MQIKSSDITIYKASAGSGKTYVLTKEYLKLLFKKSSNYKHILAVTFTNKACSEMKERIVFALYDLSLENPKNSDYVTEFQKEFNLNSDELRKKASEILHEILQNYSFFYVETIDAFFQRIIRNFAKDLGLNSYYSIELDTVAVIGEAVKNLYLQLHDNPEIQEWINEFTESKINDGKSRNIFNEIIEESKILTSEKFIVHNSEFIPIHTIVEFFAQIEQYEYDFSQKINKKISELLQNINSFGLQLTDFYKGKTGPFSYFNKLKNSLEELPSVNAIEKLQDENFWFSKTSNHRHLVPQLIQAGLKEQIAEILQSIIGDEGTKYRTAEKILSNKYSIGLLKTIQNQIDKYCRDEEKFLISNTNILLRKIIDEQDAPFIYEKIGCYINYMMIDEFQDTSVMQWANFLPLIRNSISEGGKALVVGDVKQAIYRFRNGDWNLLFSQIYKDFPNSISEINLEYNWRSLTNITDFNNSFFKHFVSIIQNKYEEDVAEISESVTPEMKQRISLLYKDLKQEKPSQIPNGGVVQCIPVVNEKNKDDVNNRFSVTLHKVLHLFSIGFHPDDIVFLVKSKKEARAIVDFFNSQKKIYPQYTQQFTVVSSEALLLRNSGAVQFILAYLQWIENPYCDFSRTFLLYTYSSWKNSDEQLAVNTIFENESEFGEYPQIQRNKSIYEIVEHIIEKYSLCGRQEDISYIIEFQNLLHSFSKNKGISVSLFLDWWEQNKDKLYLKQDAIGYMRVMTIHKSKGLQFPIVIMPFADWKFENSKAKALFTTENTDFPDIPVISVPNSNSMKYTQFSQQYAEEKLQVYIDSVNALYVACTRPEQALYMMYDTKSIKSSIAQSIQSAISCMPNEIIDSVTTEDGQFILGDEQSLKPKSEAKPIQITMNYPVFTKNKNLLPDPEAVRFSQTVVQKNDERIFGVVMHKILEYIVVKDDIESAVQKCVSQGIISDEQKQEYIDVLFDRISNPLVQDWFSINYKVLTEQSIITFEGEKRPDRILIQEQKAIVVDYKFTREKDLKHSEQVGNYLKLLNEMGYTAQGYVWYVMKNEIVEVT